jgi:hypothetical protein
MFCSSAIAEPRPRNAFTLIELLVAIWSLYWAPPVASRSWRAGAATVSNPAAFRQ